MLRTHPSVLDFAPKQALNQTFQHRLHLIFNQFYSLDCVAWLLHLVDALLRRPNAAVIGDPEL